MEEFHANGLFLETLDDAFRRDTVLGHESFQHVQTLRGGDVDPSVLERAGGDVRGVFDQPGIHEVLTDALGHLSRHGECGGRGGSDDPCRVLGIGGTRGLGELEGSQIGSGFVAECSVNRMI
jgi:hypothetical protein